MLNVEANGSSLRELIAALQLHLDKRLVVQLDGDRMVQLSARGIPAREALRRAATHARLSLAETKSTIVLTDPREPVLFLDVKNADVREILRSVKSQCGIRNMMIDPEVSGQGTFLFSGVPCGEGIRIILASLGLGVEIEQSVVHVTEER